MLARGLVVLLVTAAVLVPSAEAARRPAVELSLVPLSRAAIGTPARALPLQHDSGVISNATAAFESFSGTATMFQNLGRLTGYALDYGDGFGNASGVTEVATEVDRYKSAADAKKGLAFWKLDEAVVGKLGRFGFQASQHAFSVPTLGRARFGTTWTGTVPGVAPTSVAIAEVADGTYALDASVSAGSAARAKTLATKLIEQLDARLHLALAGRLHGKTAKLPAKLKAGPPRGGPDLAPASITPTDLGQGTVEDQGYSVDPEALSDYGESMEPGGSFDALSQQIEWYPSAAEASFLSIYQGAALGAAFAGPGSVFTPVDVSSVGDDARGAIEEVVSATGSQVYLAIVTLANGHATDLLFGLSKSAPIQASDVANLAQIAANKLNAVVGG